jgi:hypothetical protein
MCREEAAGLASLIPRLKAEGVHPRLIGVVHEDQYLKGFPQYFSGGEIFFDQDRKVYEAMGGLFMYAFSLLGSCCPLQYSSNFSSHDLESVRGSMFHQGLLGFFVAGCVEEHPACSRKPVREHW